MLNNTPHNALRNAINRAISEGAPVYENIPATPNIGEELERLVNASSILDVLCALHLICDDRADEEQLCEQADTLTAKRWRKDARIIENAMQNVFN